jgi:actin-related protein
LKNEFQKWKTAIESQIVDRSDSLWVKPNRPLTDKSPSIRHERNVLIIDIGTCSIRAGLFETIPQLPSLFVPTCCSKDPNNGSLKVGFDAFDTLLSSAAPSTIDLSKSTWSLTSTVNFSSSQLVFPLKNKAAVDKLNFDISSIDAIINYVVESLNVVCQDYEILIITPQKFSDKLNVQFLNLLLENEKYQFKGVTLMNQSLLSLYSYNSSIGVVANLGEKIDIVPICNGNCYLLNSFLLKIYLKYKILFKEFLFKVESPI